MTDTNEWMNEWVSEWVGDWVNQRINDTLPIVNYESIWKMRITSRAWAIKLAAVWHRVSVDSDTLIVVTLNAATSVFAGFAIFSILGHLAHTLNASVDKVVASGPFILVYLSINQRRRWMEQGVFLAAAVWVASSVITSVFGGASIPEDICMIEWVV